MSLSVRISIVGWFLVHACVSVLAEASPPSCGTDYHGTVWMARSPSDWPQDVTPLDLYVSPPDALVLQGDGKWYPHGGSKKDSIGATFQVSGCRYPKYDFTFNLYYSRREMHAELPTHTIDPYFINVDRMASVPITTDSNEFRMFCGGTTDELRLTTPYVLTDADDYPIKSGNVLFDNYAGCFWDGSNYYVRRGMAVQSNDLDTGGLSVMHFNNSTHGAVQLACDGCAETSFVRIYHPDANTWIVAPEDTSGIELPDQSPPASYQPWVTAYHQNVGKGTVEWEFRDHVALPFLMIVKRQP